MRLEALIGGPLALGMLVFGPEASAVHMWEHAKPGAAAGAAARATLSVDTKDSRALRAR